MKEKRPWKRNGGQPLQKRKRRKCDPEGHLIANFLFSLLRLLTAK